MQGELRLSRRDLFLGGIVVSLALGVLFAYLAVFDTNELPVLRRLAFWTATFIVGNSTSAFTAPWIVNRALAGRSPVLHILTIAAISSLPVTLVLYAHYTSFRQLWSFQSWVLNYGYVMTVSLMIAAGAYVALKAFGLIGGAGQDAPAEGPGPVEKFLERLPVRYRGAQLYAISSEDHYLRVHTDRGEELILMRLSDALRELDGAEGTQTHRSWWVAREGVAEATRENGRHTLTLKSGATAPVSRSFAAAAKERLL